MKYTNKYGIPQEVVDAILNDRYSHEGDISVTSLLLPPRIRVLRKRHWAEIEEDVSDRLYALYGQVIHGVLERSDDFEAFHEERLYIEVNGWKLTGQTDLYKRKSTGEHILRDYKFTSVFTANKEKPEWKLQANIYAWMWRQHGFNVDKAQIVLLFRDWRKREFERSNGSYPPPVLLVDVPLLPDEEVQKIVENLVELHQIAEGLPDELLPICSPEERWERGGGFAVMKEKRKTALRVFDTEEEAKALIDELISSGKKGKFYIEKRQAEPVRCLYFCNVNKFCSYFREHWAGETIG
ncbi:MAG: PD-(D/E)XK nuclease family protein [Deltaproteobacteria bacterium]|nr:PD-(D/E)XK nuclease family protein [Deltaproteobacteria bacterium]